ncbi:MAG TPA: hypothetical protein VKK79_15285 [Candidatus Lokiarchaeia archaeon]|nr:hypothetical protein [Candidatus Lokiarchaeia archaeon]
MPLQGTALYPIEGPLREALLIPEFLVVLFSIEICCLFAFRSWKGRTKAREQEKEGSWAILFLFWGLMWGFIIAGDYFAASGTDRLALLSLGYFLMSLGIWIFIADIERRDKSGSRMFTYIFGVAAAIMFSLFFIHNLEVQILFIEMPLVQWVALAIGGSFILIFIIYLLKMNKRTRIGLRYFALLLIGAIFFSLGFGGTMDFVSNWFGPFVAREIGDYVEIFGLFLMALFLSFIPNFAEWDWKIHTKVFILSDIVSGVVLFTHRFDMPEEIEMEGHDPDIQELLTASALACIKEVLKQISEGSFGSSEPPNRIKQEDKLVLLEYGEKFAAAAVCDRYLRTVVRFMKQILEKVELIYQGSLQDWDGDLNFFRPVGDIFQSIFLQNR